MTNEGIFDRQKELNISPPERVHVVGLGGVGSWVALNMAMAGTRNLYIYDPDIIEGSNLNRTPYKQTHIGINKAIAMMDLIKERRIEGCDVMPFPEEVNSKKDLFGFSGGSIHCEVLVDCRDVRPMAGTDLTGGYDGKSITLHAKPKPSRIWGKQTAGTYSITPSYIVPPQLIASFITNVLCTKEIRDKLIGKRKKERIVNFNIDALVNELWGVPHSTTNNSLSRKTVLEMSKKLDSLEGSSTHILTSKDKKVCREAADKISKAFDWNRSPEGTEFWSEIYKVLRKKSDE